MGTNSDVTRFPPGTATQGPRPAPLVPVRGQSGWIGGSDPCSHLPKEEDVQELRIWCHSGDTAIASVDARAPRLAGDFSRFRGLEDPRVQVPSRLPYHAMHTLD